MWIDSHFHPSIFLRDAESWPAVRRRASAAGVGRVVAIGTDAADAASYRALAAAEPGFVAWTAGLHPGSVDADWEAGVRAVAELVRESLAGASPRPAALGEIGLDAFRRPADPAAAARQAAQQGEAFRVQLGLAREYGLPVVVHSRAAHAECVAAIDASDFPWERVVFHCFVGGARELDELTERGAWVSYTGILTYGSAGGLREAARARGLFRVMVETDSPYLAPVPHRGETNEPARVAVVGEALARVLGLPAAEVAAATTRNAAGFFGLPAC